MNEQWMGKLERDIVRYLRDEGFMPFSGIHIDLGTGNNKAQTAKALAMTIFMDFVGRRYEEGDEEMEVFFYRSNHINEDHIEVWNNKERDGAL